MRKRLIHYFVLIALDSVMFYFTLKVYVNDNLIYIIHWFLWSRGVYTFRILIDHPWQIRTKEIYFEYFTSLTGGNAADFFIVYRICCFAMLHRLNRIHKNMLYEKNNRTLKRIALFFILSHIIDHITLYLETIKFNIQNNYMLINSINQQ